MKLALLGIALAASLGSVLGGPLAAEPAGDAKARKGRDMNEIVCEKEEVLGSRLAVRRVCMTRGQWAERRRDDRDLVHHSQMMPCVRQNKQGC